MTRADNQRSRWPKVPRSRPDGQPERRREVRRCRGLAEVRRTDDLLVEPGHAVRRERLVGSRSGCGQAPLPTVAPMLQPGAARRPLDSRWAPVIVAVVVSAALQAVWLRFLATSGGDLAAQDAWAGFARAHPGSAYNLAWYGGMHPVSYSVISPFVMAGLGVRTTMVVTSTAAAALLAWLLTH